MGAILKVARAPMVHTGNARNDIQDGVEVTRVAHVLQTSLCVIMAALRLVNAS